MNPLDARVFGDACDLIRAHLEDHILGVHAPAPEDVR